MSSRVRVLQIITGFAVEAPLGGIERFVIELVKAIDNESCQPIVFGLWDWGTPYDEAWQSHLAAAGIRTFTGAPWNARSPYLAFLESMRGIRKTFNEPVDIIHSHSQFGDVAALYLRRHLHAQKLIRTVHNEREWPKQLSRRLLLTNGLFPLLYDVELGVSKKIVGNLINRPLARLLQKEPILAHNALNAARFEKQSTDGSIVRQELGLPNDAIVVGSIGRLTKQKGYEFLIHSFPDILKQFPNAYLLIVGGGELKEDIRKIARKLGIDHRVRIPGPLSNIERIYTALDIFVSSSLWEGLPTVVMEAMISQVPVIATAVSGNTELVNHEQTGLLVPSGDSQALTYAVNRLLDNKPFAQQLAITAKQFILAHFSMSVIAEQHSSLYSDLMIDR